MKNKLTMLMILDGFGDNKNEKGNSIELAKTPNIKIAEKTKRRNVKKRSKALFIVPPL